MKEEKILSLVKKECPYCKERTLHEMGFIIEDSVQLAVVSYCLKCKKREEIAL